MIGTAEYAEGLGRSLRELIENLAYIKNETEKYRGCLHDPLKYPDGPSYKIEMFGLVNGLVAYRMITDWVQTDVGDIQFLPACEFDEKFKRFKTGMLA